MNILRQSTITTIKFGPFVDKDDGVTLETGLVTALDNATTGIRVTKNGGNYIDRDSGTAPTYDETGEYNVELSVNDTDTVGRLRVIFEEAATTLPVWQDYQVISQPVYDALYATGAVGYGSGITKNAAFSDFEFLMVDVTDGHTAKTGLSPTGERSIDGGAFVAVSGAIAEVSDGIYQFDALAADTNGDVVTWKFSGTDAADAFFTFKTVS